MKQTRHIILIVALIAIYFGVSWFYPWQALPGMPAISSAYLWDFVFAFLVVAALTLTNPESLKKKKTKRFYRKGFLIRLSVTLLLGFASLYLLNYFNFSVPFRYVERPIFQLLILAPIFEELVFRYGFLSLFLRLMRDDRPAIFFSAVLFALSHLSALWHLPSEFHSFVAVQLVYTFILGWVLGKSFAMSRNILFPIMYHFVFNLIFYVGILNGYI